MKKFFIPLVSLSQFAVQVETNSPIRCFENELQDVVIHAAISFYCSEDCDVDLEFRLSY
jgi:hypothetical protein